MTARSWLFAPGGRPDRMAKAMQSAADAVILDLEDSVLATDKAEARAHVCAALATRAPDRCVGVRVNAPGTGVQAEDVEALLAPAPGPAFLVVPKVEDPTDLARLVARAADVPVVALVESARGVVRIGEIAAVAGLHGLMFGAADYAADLGSPGLDHPHAFARAAIGNAAAAFGLIAIDSPAFALDDAAGLTRDCETARAMGFSAKALIHPRQIEPVNAAFGWSPADRERAERILDSLEGVGVLDGRMIDEAMARWARRVLAPAHRGCAE